MPIKLNISDTWKSVAGIQVNIGDVWKVGIAAWINIGDVWKQFWSISLLSGLTHYYNFDSNANDLVGSYHGTVSGATNGAGGIANNCYTFDGADDYIQMDKAVINGTAFSISFWEFTTDGNEGYFLGDGNDAGNLFMRRAVGFAGENVTIGIGDKLWTENPALSNSVWHHHVLTNSTANETLWYIDGSLAYGVMQTGSNFSGGLTSNFMIGNRTDLARDFNGKIDEVGIWNRVLTSAEVTTLYNNGNGIRLR